MPATKFRTQVKAAAGFVADELFTAATDLSSRQYYFVVAGAVAGEVTVATGASNPTPLGVLQNAPTASTLARVRIFGKTTLQASPNSCNIGYGRFISCNACGGGISSLENACVTLGRWLSASTATCTTGTAFINCAGFSGSTPGGTAS